MKMGFNITRANAGALLLLLIILVAGAWVRFDGITEEGVRKGADAFNYYKEAKLWADGQPPQYYGGNFYRPVSYSLQGLAIRIFGFNDYAIKMMHCLMDMITIFLVFMSAYVLTRDFWLGAISSLLYTFLPGVIGLVRWEMLHAESTFFVTLAFFLFASFIVGKYKKGVKLIFLFISGVSLGLAANTHADLAFLGPAFIFFQFIEFYNSQDKKESIKKFLLYSIIFTFGFFTPYLVGAILLGVKNVLRVFYREITLVNSSAERLFGQVSKPRLFFRILSLSFAYCIGKQIIPFWVLLIGAVFIMVYRRIKKRDDLLLAYFPLILIFFYVLMYTILVSQFGKNAGRLFLPLVPMVIVTLTVWYHKLFQDLIPKHSMIAFVCLFLIIFFINPKVIPGEKPAKSRYRLVYEMLKNNVNSENKILIAPLTIYAHDKGFQSELYFGKNASYMLDLSIKDKYNLKSLKNLLVDKNIRYVFLSKQIDQRLLNPEFYLVERYRRKGWMRKEGSPYSLDEDMGIIHAYIRSRNGILIDKNRYGNIYYLLRDKPGKENTSLIPNGSFEHWWNRFPMGEWKLVSGTISMSGDASDGKYSVCFEPKRADDKNEKGTRIAWIFNEPLDKKSSTLKVSVDVKAGKSDTFAFFFTAGIDGKRQTIKPGLVKSKGSGDWRTMSENIAVTPDMEKLIFHLWLLPGAGEPAYVDNLSIEIVNEESE